ncbi:hypothetical protein AJ78_09036 [Emergomyces pasteurianus Ep9510]|uniref:HBS1-like protein N-terminal domain-containing protein n=1 Tax=Emergomyces pasteurianus Ep9510 TaxID=1447872 RepID=A0A1J9NY33_9EURO|nr:hypothetical protein AJ78_09036 [Emergomyces pasteurianus Ep9510]
MSRNRIKNIAYDDDDFASASDGDDDGGFNGRNDMTPEDREQMRQCSIQVREQLDADTPPVPASDEEIWESLWYYYYDVGKTVGWLRSMLILIDFLETCAKDTEDTEETAPGENDDG